ncbi:GGDEF domain-containing protein [Coralloluteibacterium thermophilus]|uniref:diguanylate cyclase n=1 Tax=Coralloluteibacterium thermophilum TaxID=2707049 RepID=A0ABV9NI88_9GAMM
MQRGKNDPPAGAEAGPLRRLFARRQAPPAAGVPALAGDGAAATPPRPLPETLRTLFSGADSADALLRAFAEGLIALEGELADMGRRLRRACDEDDRESAARTLRQLVEKYIATIDTAPRDPAPAVPLRELLAATLAGALAEALRDAPALAADCDALAARVRAWRPGDSAATLAEGLQALTHRIALHADDAAERHALLMGLFGLLLENVGELLDSDGWLHGQVEMVRQLISAPIDRLALEDARAALREAIVRQGVVRSAMSEAREAMTAMTVAFVDRLETVAASTGEFHARIDDHAGALRQVRSIGDLNRVLDEVLRDTGAMQAQMLRARDEMQQARRDAAAAEARVRALEDELRSVSAQVREDPLTGGLNRRGLDEVYAREVARCERRGSPLCLALLDLDDFRQLNARLGHLGGDAALRHLVATVRTTLREVDAIARFGGEEFLILLPDTDLASAVAAMVRVQRALTQAFFLHDNERVFITFSAGVALRRPGESQDALLRRADAAMYAAKRKGRNRVEAA